MKAAATEEKTVYMPFEYVEQVEELVNKAAALRGLYDGFLVQFVDNPPEHCAMEVQNRYACYSATADVLTDLIIDLQGAIAALDRQTQIAAREGGAAE